MNRLLTHEEVDEHIVKPLTKKVNQLFADVLRENPNARITTTWDENGNPKILLIQVDDSAG